MGVFSLGGLYQSGCCCGGSSPCFPCDIPLTDLTLTSSGTYTPFSTGISGPYSISITLTYYSSLGKWVSDCLNDWPYAGAADDFGCNPVPPFSNSGYGKFAFGCTFLLGGVNRLGLTFYCYCFVNGEGSDIDCPATAGATAPYNVFENTGTSCGGGIDDVEFIPATPSCSPFSIAFSICSTSITSQFSSVNGTYLFTSHTVTL